MPRTFLLVLALPVLAVAAPPGPNPAIGYTEFMRNVVEVSQVREARRVSEEDFIRMAAEPGTVVLDARSERLYRLRHVKGAVNLSFPEFTEETLAGLIPAKDTRVLIYCNNNFRNAPVSMPTKAIGSALNMSTFVSLRAYGYENVYELGPLIDVGHSKLAFAGEEAAR